MSQGPAAGESSEPEAKVLHTKRLYRAVVEAVHRLDLILCNKTAYQEVFKPENISLRNKLRELCVKLMFLHPVDYGRKAEELLWRKVYYEVIQLIKTNKKHIHSRSTLECAYRTHLVAGIGFYQHLLLYIQSHYQLELQCCIDWTHVTDPLIGCKKPVSASGKEMDWAQMACHRCLVYLGDLSRYQNELAGVDTELLAERFYYQALSVAPQIGMPFNQLGTLAGSKYYNVEAMYCYLRCIQSEVSFEGAYGNLKRLFDKAAKMYHQLKKCETRKLSPSKKRCKDIKRLLVNFMYLQSLLQPKSSSVDSELTALCQSVLEDFNLCLFYLPSSPNLSLASEDEEEYESGYAFLPDLLIFQMVIICLMGVHSLKRAGSKQYSAAIAFTLALFSHLVNHVNIRLQAELEEGENPVPAFQSDGTDEPESKEPLEKEEEPPPIAPQVGEVRKNRKFSRLSCLRRRRRHRHLPKAGDDSDLSEGFESDSSHDSARNSEGSDSGSDKSLEGGETAFDAETDSEMNSQESRSDLEDMEDEEGTRSPALEPPRAKSEAPESLNGPLGPSEASIASNLQAMSTQMFQTKRCFRLAPTFSNLLPQPTADPHTLASHRPCVNGDVDKPSEPASEEGSESEASESSGHSCRNERSIQEKLQVLMAEGLLPAVKVFLDWLRTNPDLIIVCAQSSQSLWNRLSVLLNLLPAAGELQESGLALCPEVHGLLEGCELPDLPSSLLLPEDMALRNLPPLRAAHRRFNFDTDRPLLSTLEESVVRICCIRSFGHFVARLQGSILQFSSEVGIFVSTAQSEQESLLQQAQAQFRMAQEEARRNRLMRDMAQLRLQLEVSQLEGSLQQPKAQSAMSPYLVPDTQALCHHLPIIRQLATSGRFIVIIPRTVIDGLDLLKKEHPGARDGIRYLEAEFKKGNRYIRCQKEVGKSFERHKLKRQDADAWTLYKILDSCKQLTLAQGAGEEDPGGMVTIITGLPLDNPSMLSGPMQVGSPAGRCACQCGHQECPGLLQAVEGDWLRLIPKPCSGADSRSLLPSLAAGTTTCSHPTTDSRTHSGRKPSCTQAEGGPRSQLGGWAPPVAKTTSGSEESIWSRRGLWAPSQPSCLNPPAVPRGGWQAWVSEFHWHDSWTSEGKGCRRGPSSPKMGGGWARSLDPPVLGKRRQHQVSGWFSADPALLRDHPFSFPLVGPGQLWSFGDSSRRGAWSWLHWQGAGLASLPCCWGCTPSSPLLLSLCLASRAGSRPHQLWAVWPVCQGGVLVPTSPTVTVLCALGCCAATVGCQ